MFEEPQKAVISSKEDLDEFLGSDSFEHIVGFVVKLSNAVKGKSFKPTETPPTLSKTLDSIVQSLAQLTEWVDQIDALPNSTRFGNKAFCTFIERVKQNSNSLLEKILPEDLYPAIVELSPYFCNSWGDEQRIDYGSGHELNFVMFLYCLNKLGLLSEGDFEPMVLIVFARYLALMRKLQLKYWLEPAGSHGVWGLDDYQFLPFLFGASQLVGHKHIRPRSITNADIVETYANQYMYLDCIRFINQIKTGSFFETSPLLFDISGAKSWEKVSEGMMKMFRAEILGKLPIMKHFYFGSLIPFSPAHEEHVSGDECDAHHDHTAHSQHSGQESSSSKYRVTSCCVQRIPSSIAARDIQNQANR